MIFIPRQITPNDPIGEIVAHVPRASDVFKQYSIDYCCGGHRPLSEAIQEQNLNEAEIIGKLEEIQQASTSQDRTDWQTAPLTELVDHVIDTHHAYLNRSLPELSEMTTAILRAHGAKHEELREMHRLFHQLKTELDSHLIDEEEVVFPLVKDYEDQGSTIALSRAVNVIKKLEEEHDGAGEILHQLREITRDYSVPDDGCTTYDNTYRKLKELENDMFQHIHLENNILHPRLKEELRRVQNQNLH